MSQQGPERCAGLLRAWHLALLRVALTRDNADRLGVLTVATALDRLGQSYAEPSFSFFRRASAELFAAILHRPEGHEAMLCRYLSEIEDARLHRALAAAFEISQRKSGSVQMHIRSHHDLWRGLPPRNNPNRL